MNQIRFFNNISKFWHVLNVISCPVYGRKLSSCKVFSNLCAIHFSEAILTSTVSFRFSYYYFSFILFSVGAWECGESTSPLITVSCKPWPRMMAHALQSLCIPVNFSLHAIFTSIISTHSYIYIYLFSNNLHCGHDLMHHALAPCHRRHSLV